MPDILQYYGHIFVWEWLDTLWIPLALCLVHKGQRIKAVGFLLTCMLVLRLQIQIVEQMGLTKGLTGLIDWPFIVRGYVIYGIFFSIYLLLSYLSPFTRGAIYLAASLSIFFVAFSVSSIVLIL